MVKRGLARDLTEARELITRGLVRVNGLVRDSVESKCDENDRVALLKTKKFVSRGGDKLEAALKEFQVDPSGMVCLDIGSSTGGFTDCLLQHNAARVYCVDVGYGILDWKLRSDDRVVVLERTNARFLTTKEIPEPIDLCVIDASFISLNLLLEPILPFFREQPFIIALVKPQFQLPPEKIGKGGIVRDKALHQEALDMVRSHAETLNLTARDVTASPIRGAKGNQEYLMLLTGQCEDTH